MSVDIVGARSSGRVASAVYGRTLSCLLALGLGLAAVADSVQAQSAGPAAGANATPEDWRPQRGQSGKDVMWLPTSDELVNELLATAKVGPEDLVYDLGAGDGKIAIAAGLRYGARAIGIEYNPRLAEHAQRNVVRAGVADRVSIRQGDLFQTDFSQATVVTLYLLEELNQQLRPTLLAMRPGTRVVSNSFAMGDWEPDRVVRAGNQTGYFWIVPAPVAGDWILEGLPGIDKPVRLSLIQRYQRLAGTMTLADRIQPLLTSTIHGSQLELRFIDALDLMRTIRLEWRGDRLEGEVVPPYGMVEVFSEPARVRATRAGK